MKKILQIFPHGVIITSKHTPEREAKHLFTNKVFDQDILEIRRRIDELEAIDVRFEENTRDEMATLNGNLLDFLKQQQAKVTRSNSLIEVDLEISEKPENYHNQLFEEDKHSIDEENQEKSKFRSFHTKSFEVEFEGSSCLMHVFIDTTNILKLEEAKNNIKCQKIMFASASHELRTPLNAILNSYQIVGDSFKQIMMIISSIDLCLIPRREKILQCSQRIEKFVKMGTNSSVLLLSLIENILDLSKIEAGTFELYKEKFGIRELIDDVEDMFKYQ
jgi:signal transduction histidine kinase